MLQNKNPIQQSHKTTISHLPKKNLGSSGQPNPPKAQTKKAPQVTCTPRGKPLPIYTPQQFNLKVSGIFPKYHYQRNGLPALSILVFSAPKAKSKATSHQTHHHRLHFPRRLRRSSHRWSRRNSHMSRSKRPISQKGTEFTLL